jgi:hypothetical protein
MRIKRHIGIEQSGMEFEFKTKRSVNPDLNDLGSNLGGKFKWIKFSEDQIVKPDKKDLEKIQNAYVEFTTDGQGFAKIRSVAAQKTISNFWVRARVNVNWKDSTRLLIFYPFNNYYIQEFDNEKVESLIKKELCDTLKTIFLKVKIKSICSHRFND